MLSAKLAAAIAGMHSIIAVDEVREAVIGDYQKRIEIRGGMIEDLQKVNSNNQKIDVLGMDTRRIMEDQHRDDKNTIGQLQDKLDSCRSNQKFVFIAGAAAGGAIAWKIKGNSFSNLVQNPFSQYAPAGSLSMYQPTAEQRADQALRKLFLK